MSAIYFDATHRPRSILSQLAAWLGAGHVQREAREGCATASDRALRCGTVASAACAGADCGGEVLPSLDAPQPDCDIAAQLRAAELRGQQMERAFSQYISPQLVERLMADPTGLSLGGETREVTVLFADLRGFTTLAESLKDNPRRLNELVNAFLEPITDIVLAHGGTIDKYMGDCVMAFWGAPDVDADHARHAFEAAKAMLEAMDGIDRRVRAAFAGERDMPPIQIGIGINSGECIVGNLGSRRRFDYSVLGDPVNVASRIEGLCRIYDIPLLIGEATARQLPEACGLAEIGRLSLRGRAEKQWVFSLAHLGAPSEPVE
ncbi:adenylate/guanylate cyclase domain-containing protein [Phenylobacterium sp.]|uniref:adenylate/guanylate cyclase domain-containing protein n=1 Tax=Phenylobacterium sp. TaxID=1871053 RepID=UPI0025FF5E6E|nr:adenylate/guanylate cyclase domain-containing protein [Phenylobacterium sp.]